MENKNTDICTGVFNGIIMVLMIPLIVYFGVIIAALSIKHWVIASILLLLLVLPKKN